MERIVLSSPKRLPDYSHNELVKFLAENNDHELAWREFVQRFGKFIAAVIVKECRRLNFKEGLNERDDLFQDVFIRLREKDCKALRNFQAKNQQSIIKYLRIIATRIVLNHLHYTLAGRRRAPGGVTSIDKTTTSMNGDKEHALKDLLGSETLEDEQNFAELSEEVDDCMGRILKRVRSVERNAVIFSHYLYGGFQAQEIAGFAEFSALSTKRIANIISALKEKLRNCLLKKGLGKK